MHETLMQVPNRLFYDNLIKCGYVGDEQKILLFSDKPFLFVDVKDGQEKIKGTSFCNYAEVEATIGMQNLCCAAFDEAKKLHSEVPIIPEQRFTRNSIYVITPYNAQKNLIADRLAETNNEDQVISIDSSQGREFDIVFVSMVRTKPGNFITEYNRINVGITRAKHGLVIIGNKRNLAKDPKWAQLLHDHRDRVVDNVAGAERWMRQ